uniref:Uncharacterized protein n=1 Tax=Physcomitrium patens TaxID=3218 RepID=A0A2K1J9N5_PHYPA|nr:hypothetical protein PHYPA_021353 [Physcomitrium patens]
MQLRRAYQAHGIPLWASTAAMQAKGNSSCCCTTKSTHSFSIAIPIRIIARPVLSLGPLFPLSLGSRSWIEELALHRFKPFI